ncbi:DUF3297 family protein [Sphingorhabdus sp. SMR4y]|uniref:DUF3297 family protein n=1 Tax=Sphingorhabdus sp. SMR4y TaxID=2584094 RepID=UPI000B5C5570|nr:DUF3297 family protein [Sphingorhabdus sp. SMR4y]ASK87308.1 glutathione peroxidase [Sphingorhabdus sp. SMR4y]
MTENQQPDPANSAASGQDTPPDRLAINPRSPHYGGELLTRGIGINFRGTRKHNIEEYCVSEGWVKVQAGKTMDRKGNPLLIKLNGEVEAWFEDLGDDAPKTSISA